MTFPQSPSPQSPSPPPDPNQPPDLSVRNVLPAVLVALVGVLLVSYALMAPIRILPYGESVASEDDVEFSVSTNSGTGNRVDYGVACDRSGVRCTQNSVALLSSAYMSDISLLVLQRAYQRRPFETLCLNSPGGSVFATIDMAKWVQAQGIQLCAAEGFVVEHRSGVLPLGCYSSCAILFAASERRLGVGALPVIGVHDVYYQQEFPRLNITTLAECDLLSLAISYRLRRLGIPWETLSFFFATPSSDMYELSVADIKQLRLFTSVL